MAEYKDHRQTNSQTEQSAVPSLGKTIAKIAVGAIVIAVGLEDVFSDFTGFLIALIIGAALIAWGLIPYYQQVKKAKAEETERILRTPVEKFDEKDEAERLAEKYYNK